MRWGFEIRKRLRRAAPTVLLGCLGLYLAYHTVHGDRGLIAYLKIDYQIEQRRGELAAVRTERAALDRRVALMSPQSLDPDLLTEQAHAILNYGRPSEQVYIYPAGFAED